MTDLHVTRIGHSCHLVEIAGQRLLTDPWFTVTPTYDPGEPVSLSVEQLPELDGVIITHEHYDHCDLNALADYREPGVPVVVPPTVAVQAPDHRLHRRPGAGTLAAHPDRRRHRHRRPGQAWRARDHLRAAGAGPHRLLRRRHAGDPGTGRAARAVRALRPGAAADQRPVHPAHERPADGDEQAKEEEAAGLTAVLRPDVAIPHHYAFTSGWLGDRLITRSDPDPRHFAEAARRLAPATTVLLNPPGGRVSIP